MSFVVVTKKNGRCRMLIKIDGRHKVEETPNGNCVIFTQGEDRYIHCLESFDEVLSQINQNQNKAR